MSYFYGPTLCEYQAFWCTCSTAVVQRSDAHELLHKPELMFFMFYKLLESEDGAPYQLSKYHFGNLASLLHWCSVGERLVYIFPQHGFPLHSSFPHSPRPVFSTIEPPIPPPPLVTVSALKHHQNSHGIYPPRFISKIVRKTYTSILRKF